MKNLKRALSLVLSTAMVLGMMVVGSGAAFADVKAAHNEEAIAVAQAAGIFTGDENGNFNPDNNITRNEMAVVMVNLLDLDTADFNGASGFTDVPAWAAPYVDACYANGIVSGISATEFGGSDNVTTAQAALMMLKALGYFDAKGFDNWLLDTIKQASRIDLLDGIDAAATDALTRNEVAQLVLNTLESTCVEEIANGSNTSIKGDNLEITIGSTVTTNERTTSKYDYNDSGEKSLQLIEELFGNDFTKELDGETALGLPAVVWYDEDDSKIIAVADDADVILISDASQTALELYLDDVDDDFDDGMNEIDTEAGDVVYYYENDDDSITAYVVSYVLAEITDIDDDLKKAEIEDGHAFEVELNDGEYYIYDDDFADYDYAEGDYVLVALNDDEDEVLASELADIIEGEIKAVKSNGRLNIGGTYYKNLTSTSLEYGDEVTVVLNKAGQIILVDELNESVKSDDFAYIYNIKENDGDTNDDGVSADGTYTAYLVLADGSKAKYLIEEDSVEYARKGSLIAYSVNSDDELEVEASDYTVAHVAGELSDDSKSVKTNDGKVYANSKTEFIFAAWDDDTMVVTTATGIKNVDIDGEMFVIYDEDDMDALMVFVMAEDEGLESDTAYAVLISSSYIYTEDNDDPFYTYTVWADGEEIEMSFEKKHSLEDGEVFAYYMDGDYAVISESEYELEEGTVTYEGEDFFEVDGAEYTVADDAEIYVVVTVLDSEGEYDYTEVKKTGSLDKNDEILFYANSDDEIEIVFIKEIDD